MSRRENVEEILGKAVVLEKNYDWAKAADLYEQALRAVGKRDFLKKGEIQERFGFCFHRGAFQAESKEDFRERMRRAIEAYEKAEGFYERMVDEQKDARMFRCRAIVKYLGYWFTSDPSEKRRLLDECLELEGKGLAGFSGSGDMLEYGRTYNELWLVFMFRSSLEWNRQTLESILKQGLEWGEKAVAELSELGDSYELAKAYLPLARCLVWFGLFFLAELEERDKTRLKAVNYLSKAVDVSEKVGDTHLFGLAHLWWGASTESEEAVEHFQKALECGRQTRDKFLIGFALDFLAYMTYWESSATDDPDKRRKLAEEAMQFYDKAQQHFSIISYKTPRYGLISPPAGYAEHYFFLAWEETDPEKRLALLEKSETEGMNALRLAEDSDIPSAIGTVLHVLSKTLAFRASVEPDPAQRKSLLNKALT